MNGGSAPHGPEGPFHLLGMRVDTLDPHAGLEWIARQALAGRAGYCCIGNVHQCMLIHDDPEFARVVNGAALVMTDSRILHRFIAHDNGTCATETMRGADMMLALCLLAEAQNIPIGLVGGADVVWLAELERRLRASYPKLQIAYSFSPSIAGLDRAEEAAMLRAIDASGARLVFVGLGCPKQERWMARHSPTLRAMLIGVGAAFDFNGGRVRKSPRWVHAAGLEWGYRLMSEPKRLWRRYLSTSPRFLLAYVRRRSRRGGLTESQVPRS